MPVVLVFLGATDIALFVDQGRADLGITGLDIIAEKKRNVNTLCELDFGKCRLCVQAPISSNITDVSSLLGNLWL